MNWFNCQLDTETSLPTIRHPEDFMTKEDHFVDIKRFIGSCALAPEITKGTRQRNTTKHFIIPMYHQERASIIP